MPGERWLPVTGSEGRYEVSDLGRIRSLPRPRTAGGILATFTSGPMKYQAVNIDGRTAVVHILVATAFCEGREPGLEVRHLDGDKDNNAALNLRWGTSGENKLDTVSHGRHNNARKTHCANDHEFTPENTYIRPDGRRNCRRCVADSQARSRERARASTS